MMSLTAAQKQDIIIIERISSVLSLIGAAFVMVTFMFNEKFRKPINRLVFLATFGNIITNVATLISIDGIEAGTASPLCQLQGFLIQWFMPADALWTFAMACNVWLSFFQSYDSATFRRLEYKYIAACYGIPFIPAFIYLFIRTEDREKIYGSAVLWCWVKLQWDFLRVASFYGPVWVVILCTFGIYIRVGKIVLDWRKSVLSMERVHTEHSSEFPPTGIMKTSEVTVTRTEENRMIGRPYSHVTKKPSFPSTTVGARSTTQSRVYRSSGATNPNKAAIKYCKCAMLFFIALIVTWVPSTINRIYNIIRPNNIVFGLNLAAALVLPLQGFWNAVIYIATSTFAVKSLWQDLRDICGIIKYSKHTTKMTANSQQLPPPVQVRNNISRSSTLFYDSRLSSSQSELVGPAK